MCLESQIHIGVVPIGGSSLCRRVGIVQCDDLGTCGTKSTCDRSGQGGYTAEVADHHPPMPKRGMCAAQRFHLSHGTDTRADPGMSTQLMQCLDGFSSAGAVHG